MEVLVMKLVILVRIRNAISQTYSDVNNCNIYHECMEMINEFEKELLENIYQGV